MIWRCRSFTFEIGDQPLLMGIVNVTPDSFSDGGDYFSEEDAIERGLLLAAQGADILDVGGESTRPGAKTVSARFEIERVVPVIRQLARQVTVPVSVDTTKAAVAQAAIAAGASIVNDISAFRFDPAMAGLVAETGAGAVLMHIKGRPRTMQQAPVYDDLIGEIRAYLRRCLAVAEQAGVAPRQLAVDPGIGFGKTPAHNLSILKHLGGFAELGRPLVAGASRKSFIGAVNNGIPPQQRLPGSIAAAITAWRNGAHILRVHDVAETKQALATYHAIEKAD